MKDKPAPGTAVKLNRSATRYPGSLGIAPFYADQVAVVMDHPVDPRHPYSVYIRFFADGSVEHLHHAWLEAVDAD